METHKVRHLNYDDLTDILSQNYEVLDALHIGDRSWETFTAPDLIAEVSDFRNPKQPPYYIAVEASYTAREEDVR